MTERLCPPDGAVRQMDVQGARYEQRKGAFEVESSQHSKLLKQAGCFPAGTQVGRRGYRCPACGFLAVLPTNCGRCGHPDLDLEE